LANIDFATSTTILSCKLGACTRSKIILHALQARSYGIANLTLYLSCGCIQGTELLSIRGSGWKRRAQSKSSNTLTFHHLRHKHLRSSKRKNPAIMLGKLFLLVALVLIASVAAVGSRSRKCSATHTSTGQLCYKGLDSCRARCGLCPNPVARTPHSCLGTLNVCLMTCQFSADYCLFKAAEARSTCQVSCHKEKAAQCSNVTCCVAGPIQFSRRHINPASRNSAAVQGLEASHIGALSTAPAPPVCTHRNAFSKLE
jgi:hypothetical protein